MGESIPYTYDIYLWSDGDWCYPEDIYEMNKSDDYIVATISGDVESTQELYNQLTETK